MVFVLLSTGGGGRGLAGAVLAGRGPVPFRLLPRSLRGLLARQTAVLSARTRNRIAAPTLNRITLAFCPHKWALPIRSGTGPGLTLSGVVVPSSGLGDGDWNGDLAALFGDFFSSFFTPVSTSQPPTHETS